MLQTIAVLYMGLTAFIQLSIFLTRTPSFWWWYTKKTCVPWVGCSLVGGGWQMPQIGRWPLRNKAHHAGAGSEGALSRRSGPVQPCPQHLQLPSRPVPLQQRRTAPQHDAGRPRACLRGWLHVHFRLLVRCRLPCQRAGTAGIACVTSCIALGGGRFRPAGKQV